MKDEDFKKLSKTQKLKMDIVWDGNVMGISRVLMLNIREKMDGYGMAAFFVKVKDNWIRVPNYDCFDFTLEESTRIKGDFEYGGIVFFIKGRMDYSGSFITK